MKLTRIRIEQFRRFRKPLEIGGLEPGINLFTGPNEAGKSTIVAAVRAAFFERHRSGSVDEFRPWGDSSASPTVDLDFTVAGENYRLTKSFLGKKRCELRIGLQQMDGAAAEDHLAGLLGFQHASKGASAAQHWGIPGLLWIQQGSAHDIRSAVGHATDHLRTALNESLGEVVSSGGDEVLAQVEEMRNLLLTPATGAPKGAYADALKRQAELAAAMAQMDAEIELHRQRVDRLASLRGEHAADAAEMPWVAFRTQAREAADKLEAIGQVEATLASDRARAVQIDAVAGLLHGQLEAFAAQQRELDTRTGAAAASERALSSTSELAAQWQARRAEASRRVESARGTLRDAKLEHDRRTLADRLEELKLKAQHTVTALAKAETEQAALIELRARSEGLELSADELAQLRAQRLRIRELQIQQAAAATRLRHTLEDGVRIQIGTESLQGSGERLLLETTTLMLPGIGRLEIVPGGTSLAELRNEEVSLGESHAALLQRLGLESLDAAEARRQAHTQHLADMKTMAATLKVLAPDGIDALRAELSGHQARAAEAAQSLARLPPAAASQAVPPSAAEAETAFDAAAASFEQTSTSLNAAQLAAGNAQAAFEAAARELAAARASIDVPDRADRLAAANRSLVETRAEQATVRARIDTLDRQITEARRDLLSQDAERFRKSAEQLEKRFEERRDALVRLEVELQAAGAQGLDEHRAELARDLAQAQRRVDELRRRALALDHLLTLLRAKRSALTRRLQAPLQKHLNRYLPILFPQASLEIDEHLSPGPLTRTGAQGAESGAYEALSFGVREQMGVISRLSYADLLKEAGRPTLIILDDALVHSDADRLAQMKRVLFDAATRHQILLFTCHPANWRDLGVAARSLDSLAE